MREVECLATYGIHYYDVRDRDDLPWYLGLSNRGIAQYDYLDKRKPRKVFLWRQLENIYFRERKFSIEVHDPKRVCVSRRSLGSAAVTVHVWFADSQVLCKAIWSMAIAQHQFYLDRKTFKSEEQSTTRGMPELAVDLSKSCLSLSTHSSSSNLSGSHSSLHQHSQTESGSSESLEAARQEMVEALKLRKSGLQEKLTAKTEELRLLCLKEGELTGELPPEYPIVPGQPLPTVRKRVGTSFALDETIINKIINKQEETVSALELECEIMAKITSAALKLANESTARKGVRRQRKLSYQQSAHRLRELEHKLKQARSKAVATASTLPKQKKKPRPLSESEGIEDSGITGSLSSSGGSTQESPRDASSQFPSSASPQDSPSLNTTTSSSITTPRDINRRDRSPHLSRSSAPASPHRIALNTTVSSSSSRPTSPSSRPARFGSLDRRRCHSGRIDIQNNNTLDQHQHKKLHDSPENLYQGSYRREQLDSHLSSHPSINHTTHHSPHILNQSLNLEHLPHEQQHHHYNNSNNNNHHGSSRSYQHNVSSSKLKVPSSSQLPTQVHNISSSSINHAHNTTVNSIGSTSSVVTHKSYSSNTSHQQPHHHSYHHNTTNNNTSTTPHHHLSNGTSHYVPPSQHHVGRIINAVAGVNPGYVQKQSNTNNNNNHQHLQQHQQSIPMPHDNTSRMLTSQASYYSPIHSSSGGITPLTNSVHNNSTFSSHPHYYQQKGYHVGGLHTPLNSRHQKQPHKEYIDNKIPKSVSSSVNCSFDTRTSGEDCVDGHLLKGQYRNDNRNIHHTQSNYLSQSQNKPSHTNSPSALADRTLEAETSSETVHTLVRTNSGRSYMETTFLGDSSSASSTTSNQENIPPGSRSSTGHPHPQQHQQHQHLPPLRPTASQLRASSSVTPADMALPRLLPAVDLIPLRATKSSSELPPLRATNPRSDIPSHVNVNNSNNNSNNSNTNNINVNMEPLISLAEAAKLKKEREREWYETCLDSPVNIRRTQRTPVAEIVINKVPNHTISSTNLNTSCNNLNATTNNFNGSINTSRSNSAYQSSNEGSDNQVSSSNNNSNSKNQSMVITTGTYQPSTEVTKPFEMSDFYKYSTKYRKQGLIGGGGGSSNNSSFSADSSSTMSPVLPPRAQVVVSSNKTAPPPSPNVISQQSTPSAQQKGVYQSLTPYECQGVAPVASSPQQQPPTSPGWDGGQLHQAVPATVTTKRSATLV